MNFTTTFLEKSAYLEKLVKNGGPQENEYIEMDKWYNTVWKLFEKGEFSKEQIEKLRKTFSKVYDTPETMFGLVFTAPYGYKGDFEIIDRIYRKHICSKENLSNWDSYFQRLSATKAVRNRKDYFKKLLKTKIKAYEKLKVLNLASGPCRDLKEFFEESKNNDIVFDCVEFDPRAIDYAKKILDPKQQVNFIQQNIFKFSTDKKYDLIWSAGLFDYFDDKTFSRILKRISNYIKENGEIVIGNFHPRNPTRNCMEFTIWKLNHRSEDELTRLAQNAGIMDISRIEIEEEAEGVNLFMKIKHGSE